MEKRLVWLDLVRVGAIFLMVLLHVSAGYIVLWQEQTLFSWNLVNVWASLSRICVPWLILMSGALLLPRVKKVGVAHFYLKRGLRILKPWIFWSVIFIFLNFLTGNEASSIKRLLVGTVWTGFWLLPVLAGFYVFTPLWLKIRNLLSNFALAVILALGVAVLLSGWHLPLYFEYFIYFVFGDLVARLPRHWLLKYLALFCFGFGWFATILLTYNLSNHNNGFVSTYYHFHTWPVFLTSMGGFILLAQLELQFKKFFSKRVMPSLISLSQVTFQLYFIHLLFFRLPFSWQTLPSWLFLPIYTLAIFGGSWLGAMILKGVPILARLSGAEERT